MGLKDWLFKKRKKQTVQEDATYDFADFSKQSTDLSFSQIKVQDDYQREKYIKNCLEQIGEVASQIDTLNMEYSIVTSYLLDIEEIEALPKEEKDEVLDCAGVIERYENERATYQGRKRVISEKDFTAMEKLEDFMPEAYEKLKAAEEMKGKIKQDLARLEHEKQAYDLQKNDLRTALSNYKSMTIITMGAFLFLMFALFLFQTFLEMDVMLGYLISIAAAALVLTVVFMKYTDSNIEVKQVEKAYNKLILLQNRVKIRYVNNTQLVDYLCLKYGVKSVKDLNKLWQAYQEEQEIRKKYEYATTTLERARRDLFGILKRYQLTDPHIWLRQTKALIDPTEMVEIRHELITRRQSLRKQLEYNQTIAEQRKEELKTMANLYPQYAKEVLSYVNEYEKNR